MVDIRQGWGRFAIFVAANVTVVALLAGLVVVPARDYLRSLRVEIDDRQTQLARDKAALARNVTVTAALRARLAEAARGFVQGDGLSGSNADLLTRLRRIAEARGVTFSSFATLPPHDWSGRPLVGARVEFSGVSRNVAALLTDIETGPCFLFIPRAHLAATQTDADETVLISLDVYGVTG